MLQNNTSTADGEDAVEQDPEEEDATTLAICSQDVCRIYDGQIFGRDTVLLHAFRGGDKKSLNYKGARARRLLQP